MHEENRDRVMCAWLRKELPWGRKDAKSFKALFTCTQSDKKLLRGIESQ